MFKKQTRKEVINVSNVTLGYEGKVILKDINFSVYEGEIFFIMGGSGCGKSTLLKHMIGLNKPYSGKITINEKIINEVSLTERRDIMKSLGVTFQAGALIGSLTLGENVSLPLEEYTELTKDERDKVIRHKLSLVGLENFIDYYPAEISGGMKKRAGLARAMALDPRILFFDEPSAGLDPITSAELDKLIKKLGKELNITVVVVSHELDSIFAIADRALLLDKSTRGISEIDAPINMLKKTNNEWVRRFLKRDGLTRKV